MHVLRSSFSHFITVLDFLAYILLKVHYLGVCRIESFIETKTLTTRLLRVLRSPAGSNPRAHIEYDSHSSLFSSILMDTMRFTAFILTLIRRMPLVCIVHGCIPLAGGSKRTRQKR
jgi:hypothetical protein